MNVMQIAGATTLLLFLSAGMVASLSLVHHVTTEVTLHEGTGEDAQHNSSTYVRKPVQWFHIHKSGGSTICAMAQQMGERVVMPHVNCDSVELHDMYEHRYDNQHGTCPERRSLFKQHGFTWGAIETQLGPGDMCPDDFMYAMYVREPIDRIESLLNYRVDEDYLSLPCRYDIIINHLWTGRAAGKFYSQCYLQLPGFDNYVIRLLGGKETMNLPPGGVNATHFDIAMSVLNRFDLAVPMELISKRKVLAHMNRLFGWNLQPAHFQERYSWTGEREDPKQGHIVQLSEEDIRRLKYINRFDIAFYNHVAGRYLTGI